MRNLVIPAVLFLVLLGLQFETAESACCRSNFVTKRCGDGTIGTPCCGYRKCNFFCCACECRHRGKRQADEQEFDADDGSNEDDEDPVSRFDEDRDGKISLPEARRWLVAGGCGNPFVKIMALSKEFGSLDTDNDGGLDKDEIGG